MKLNIVETHPPRWFLFDDAGVEFAQRADVAFYEEAVQATKKGKSVHDTLLDMEAKRLGVAPSDEQEAAGVTVTVIKVEPHEHEDYLRGNPVHDHDELYAHDHAAYATTEDVRGVLRDVHGVDLARVANNEGMQRRLDQHEAHHAYAEILHSHEALDQRIGALEKLVEALIASVKQHEHSDRAPAAHGHGELVVLNDMVRTLRKDLGAVEGQVDGQGRELHSHDHEEYATQGELHEVATQVEEQAKSRDVNVVSFRDIGGGRKRYVVEDGRT